MGSYRSYQPPTALTVTAHSSKTKLNFCQILFTGKLSSHLHAHSGAEAPCDLAADNGFSSDTFQPPGEQRPLPVGIDGILMEFFRERIETDRGSDCLSLALAVPQINKIIHRSIRSF